MSNFDLEKEALLSFIDSRTKDNTIDRLIIKASCDLMHNLTSRLAKLDDFADGGTILRAFSDEFKKSADLLSELSNE